MKMKQLINFFALVAYMLGTIGGFGYAVWGGSWPVGIAVIVLAILAFPTVRNIFQEWTK